MFASNGTNAKSLTQFLKWVQKQNSLLYFPPLASTIYSVINAGVLEAKTLLVGLFCMYGLNENKILTVSLKWRNMDCTSYWCSHWYAQHCFFFCFFLSSHTRDLNFCFYNEPPTSINELINIFQTRSEECWRNLTPIFSCSQLPCGMKTAPKVVLIRQLIQIIFCLKGSKAAAAETVHHQRAFKKGRKRRWRLRADAPVVFVKLSCVLALDSPQNVTAEIMHSFV